MKRDMDLIRLLLLEVESGEKPEAMDHYTEEQILYHCELAIEADLLDGQVVHGAQGDAVGARIQRLTWGGHEFLDAAREDSVWSQAKKKTIETGGSWTMEGLKLILFELARRGMTGQ
jgi:hypothetical protein